jgi:putative nucleotidyltransferase with HDIG domain
MERSVLDIIRKIQDIPTLPAVAMEVMSLAKQPDVSIKDISECIYKDPPLAVKVLRMANSTFYRRGSKEIDTLHRAILVMGLNEVINITTSVSVLSLLSPKDSMGESLRASFWNHCVATGLIARRIDRKLDMQSQGKDFVGGLLHDIGKIILDEYFHTEFEEAHKLSAEKGCPVHEAEMEILGTTHMEVGHFLAQKWGLPPYLGDIALNHHHPDQAQFKDVTALVSISDLLAKAKELSCCGERAPFVLKDQEAWGTLKNLGYPMDDLDVERITFEIEDIGEEVKAYISTVSDAAGEGA